MFILALNRRQLFSSQLFINARAVWGALAVEVERGGSFSAVESKVQGLWHRKFCYKTDCGCFFSSFYSNSANMSELKKVCIVGSGNW
jgi:hypothetical protein